MENEQTPASIKYVNKVQDFTNLKTWRFARSLHADVYGICQNPAKEESFVLGSQWRRAAVSVTANIAEDFGRFSHQENIQFCRQVAVLLKQKGQYCDRK